MFRSEYIVTIASPLLYYNLTGDVDPPFFTMAVLLYVGLALHALILDGFIMGPCVAAAQ